MPYTSPAGELRTRNHKRSFTDEHGNNAFAPLPSLPRRASKPAVTTTLKSPSPPISIQVQSPSTPQKKFQLKGSDDDDDDEDDDQVVQVPDSIPFPSLASPTPHHEYNGLSRSVSTPTIPSPSPQDTPSIYRSPYSSTRASPNTRNLRPLKPSLKSNHSSPHLPSLGSPHPRTVTQSAPTTPHNLPSNITPSGQNSPELDSPHSPSSALPQTPKSVHFAAEKSSLESIVVFAKTARPRSLSTGGNDTETETEGYDSSSTTWGTWNSSRYPFPVMPKTEESIVILDDSKTSLVPAPANIGCGGILNGEKAMVYLETLTLPSMKPPALRGSVLVRNVAFQKRVAVRFTLDDWQTTSEVSCPYSDSQPSLPPPFSAHSHASNPLGLSLDGTNGNSVPVNAYQPTTTNAKFSMGGKQDSWDRFTFVIKLEDVERTLVNKRLVLVVRYTVPSQWGFESGGEWWDNNLTKNYEVGFKVGKRSTTGAGTAAPSSTPTSAPATTSSSSTAGRITSLPPLPPPGPIKPSAATIGLKLKPKLAPLLPSGDEHPPVQLRQGRGPTFVEASPPGSPRKPESSSTTYTPPMPGALPISPSSSLTNVRDALGPSATTGTPSMYAEKPVTTGYASKSPGLSISTGVQPVTVPAGGKKRLSLSNYASPVKPTSTSPTTTPTTGSRASMYSTASSTSPVTPYDGGLGLKIVGDANTAAAMWFRNSGEAGLKGGEDKKNGATMPGDFTDAVQQPLLPTPPDSGADSNNSTPDLELSPEVSISEVDGHEEQANSVAPLGRKLSPPLKATSEEGDLSPSSSSSTVKLNSPRPSTGVPSGLSASRPTHKASFTTSASSQSSSSTSGSEDDDDPWNVIRPPTPEKQISNLDKRVNQGRMRLDIPSRPAWKTSPPTMATPPTMASAIPPARSFGLGSRSNSLDAVNLAGTGSATSRSPGKRSPSTLGISDTSSTPPHRTGSVDGLSSMGGSGSGGAYNGPPPEFLAKYCFFVSSPTATPSPSVPVGGGSVNGGNRGGQHSRGVSDSMGVVNKRSGYSSPNAINGTAIPISSSPGSGLDRSMYAMGLGMSPPGQGAAFTPTGAFAGIDTPRASSPGLNDGSSNWWAFGGAQKVIS
ncbi:hypothetical protein FRC02_003112 [Tulasnella sp. 418]|nr:hypothetical protein FRC02_003112 [Tulasnella sp. 418]